MGVLSGRAVVVTGAGRGLGRAYAVHAAASGAAVVVNDVDVELAEKVSASIHEAGGRAVTSGHSVADPGQAAELVGVCVGRFGAIDGLVNNAALNYQAPAWEDDDPARTRALIEVNVLGAIYCGVAAVKAMREGGGGAIVNVSSGSLLGQHNAAAYSASKGAVASLTSSWAADLAEHGIRVNAVCPQAWTRMVAADPVARTHVSRSQTPDRIAPLVAYLLSDLAEGITGQLVRFVADGLHVMRQPAVKGPVLRRDTWSVEDIAEAFRTDLAAALEPPPAERWSVR